MESTLTISTTAFPLFTVSKALNRHFTTTRSILLPSTHRRLSSISSLNNNNKTAFTFSSSSSSSSSSLRGLCTVVPLVRRHLECVSSSASCFSTASGGGGGGGSGGDFGGGSGGGGSESGDADSNLVSGVEEVSVQSPDVIILDVGGMTCGGCAASVKRILESQPHVSSANVNLATETAIVWPASEAKVVPNWQKQLGEALAKHLTSCGFTSNLRVAGQDAIEGDIS